MKQKHGKNEQKSAACNAHSIPATFNSRFCIGSVLYIWVLFAAEKIKHQPKGI
jgi:hypothetical protein